MNGKRQQVRIKVPINSDRPIKVENARKKELNEIPGQLKREIQRAFQNKTKRDSFIKDIVEHIKNFSTILENEERVKQVVSNISKHFDLKWTEDKISTYTNDVLMLYSQLHTDDAGNEFFISVDKEKIRIGENRGYARHQKYLRIK